MPSTDDLRDAIQRYVKLMNDGDADGLAELYAEDGSVEDPIGAEVVRGREAVRRFYAASAGKVRVELSGPIRACAGEAAFPLRATLGSDDDPSYLDIIDVMAFDDAGRIRGMRAFWSPDAIRKGGA